MSRILLALTILTAGTGGFLAAHNLTNQLMRELNAHHDAWVAQTQQLAAVQGEQGDLAERMRPAQIRDHVRRLIDIWKPGGGFVFQQVHNILARCSPCECSCDVRSGQSVLTR